MKKQFLEAGEFVTTHGIAGEVKLYPWSDGPEFFEGFRTFYLTAQGGHPLTLERVRPHKNTCIVKVEGIDSIEAARPLIGKTAYIARADVQLEEGRVFVQDLLGAQVVDDDTEEVYGRIVAIAHPGHHDVYEIENEAGERFYFPAVDTFVRTLDAEGGVVRIAPIPGMFDEAAEKAKPAQGGKKAPGAQGAGR